MKWTFEEDYIICSFCEEHEGMTISDAFLEELMEKLMGAGFDTRNKASIKKRAHDCQLLIGGWEAPYAPETQKERCESFARRKQMKEIYRELESYIDNNFACSETYSLEAITTAQQNTTAYVPIEPVGPTFQEMLFNFIDRNKGKDSDIYKRAQISRATFSNVRSGKKGVSKKTIMQLCFGLKLTYDEAVKFMAAADCAFNNSEILDLVVMYFLKNQIYDTYEVNAELYERNQPLLFSGNVAYYN